MHKKWNFTLLVLLTQLFFVVDTSSAYSDFEGAFSSYQQGGDETQSIVKKTDIDNHKPFFRDCSTYAPSIEEQQSKGLHVITVHAADPDPPERGGRITYSIVKRDGDRVYFKIDNATGAITTNYEFDRDEPTRMKEIYITVQATDNGRPILADICTFKVTITDINDSTPSFDQVEFNEKVSEDAKAGRVVMRVVAYDSDDGDNAKLVYSIRSDGSESAQEFNRYFRIDADSGVLYLQANLKNKRGVIFNSIVVVQDSPQNQIETKENTAPIRIEVVGSDKKPPQFITYPQNKTVIKENHSDFTNPVVTLEAVSNIADPDVQFELLKGLTAQTNKDSTFILEQNGTTAFIKLGRTLDYETVTEYQLTVRCTNKDSWPVIRSIDIEIEDVNDEIPTFIELVTGSVLENEPEGSEVMQVRAVDKDGTSANNIVSYELADHQDLFDIDSRNGKVTTKKPFDREENEVYNVNIIAKDNSKSALTQKPFNSASQTFRITIEDRNDNHPRFIKNHYVADRIPEDIDIGKDVIQVKATDRDTASLITYNITEGNIDNAFSIQTTTGVIKVAKALDYETIEKYNLTVEAFDGVFRDYATVDIVILNVNDEIPQFENYTKEITIDEETTTPPHECIITLKAYDPDIKDRNADQKISYHIGEKQKEFLSVDENGCVRVIKKLDRDKPKGYPVYQAYVLAYDDGNSATSQSKEAELYISLRDINDNAPFLSVSEVVWPENADPDTITDLQADDYDSRENGPPFSFRLSNHASEEIKSKFSIEGNQVRAEAIFDREEKKYYDIPIDIMDSGIPQLTGKGIMRVIIGDVNDNPAKDGSSSIFVYDYESSSPDMEIGRVFVDDPDDWDLIDKVFTWKEPNHYFDLTEDGMIILRSQTPEGEYTLNFIVTEEKYPLIARHEVEAVVRVRVKSIPKEAVLKSGSVRIAGSTVEEFVEKYDSSNSKSRKDVLQKYLSKILNTSLENVDVLTVMKSHYNDSLVDVRFSAHGSPYYAPEKLNLKVQNHKADLERELDVKFIMISISECLQENVCHESCSNELKIIKEKPAVVFTNRTSFVGVNAFVEPLCGPVQSQGKECLNGGTLIDEAVCNCPEGFEGPLCELLAIGFNGDGWALYRTFDAVNGTEITLEITPTQNDGLIFYAGPSSLNPMPITNDFISLELRKGYPVLFVNYGSGTQEVPLTYRSLSDGATHSIRIYLQAKEISLSVDDCHQSNCQVLKEPIGPNYLLNVNGPLQVGGINGRIHEISRFLNWKFTPTHLGFHGCVRNLTFNRYVYNLGQPGESKNAIPNCSYSMARAVSFGIDSNFLVAILVCIAILIILLLAVVVHRRKQDAWSVKEIDDVRETIINYEDEGGGEGDAGFDLAVLRKASSSDSDFLPKSGIVDVPDISGFLDRKKYNCDKDTNSYPFDDVRYYAYEGDGNSTGSLSSLASCTDDGDMEFNYLSNFGPRFRKLADMYGEDPSDKY